MPVVNGLEKEYAGRIQFLRVNILDPASRPVMERYGFTAAPELYLVSAQGRVLGSWDDFVAAGELKRAFDSALR